MGTDIIGECNDCGYEYFRCSLPYWTGYFEMAHGAREEAFIKHQSNCSYLDSPQSWIDWEKGVKELYPSFVKGITPSELLVLLKKEGWAKELAYQLPHPPDRGSDEWDYEIANCYFQSELEKALTEEVEKQIKKLEMEEKLSLKREVNSCQCLRQSTDHVIVTPLEGVVEIQIVNHNILNFRFSQFPALKKLKLQNCALTNSKLKQVLKGATSLKTLDISHNQISDLTPICDLNQIDDLDIENNQISDLTPVGKLTGVYRICLENNPISDLTPLMRLDIKFLTWDKGGGSEEVEAVALQRHLSTYG